MTEDNKRSSKTIHVDTLHIKANEVIIHQERHDGRNNWQQNQNQPPQHIERDFWGFPIPQAQGPENNDGTEEQQD